MNGHNRPGRKKMSDLSGKAEKRAGYGSPFRAKSKLRLLAGILVFLMAGLIAGSCSSGRTLVEPRIRITVPTSYFSWVTTQETLQLAGTAAATGGISRIAVLQNGRELADAYGTSSWRADRIGLQDGDNQVICQAYSGNRMVAADTIWVTLNSWADFRGRPRLSQSSFYTNEEASTDLSQELTEAEITPDTLSVILLNADFSVNSLVAAMMPVSDPFNMDSCDYWCVFSVFSQQPQACYYRLAATHPFTGEVDHSQIFRVSFHNRVSGETLDRVTSYHEGLDEVLRAEGARNPRDAVRVLANWFSQFSDVDSVSTGENHVEVNYNSGLTGQVTIRDADDPKNGINNSINSIANAQRREERGAEARGPEVGSPISEARPENDLIGNGRVLVWAPFESTFHENMSGNTEKILAESKLDLSLDTLTDSECTLSSLDKLTEYGTVILSTHGCEGKAFLTGELVTEENKEAWTLANLDGRVAIASAVEYRDREGFTQTGTFYSVRAPFIEQLGGSLPNSLVMNLSCGSCKTDVLCTAFMEKGARSYLGFSDVATDLFSLSVYSDFFPKMAVRNQSTGEAFVSGLEDPFNSGTFFMLMGSQDLRYVPESLLQPEPGSVVAYSGNRTRYPEPDRSEGWIWSWTDPDYQPPTGRTASGRERGLDKDAMDAFISWAEDKGDNKQSYLAHYEAGRGSRAKADKVWEINRKLDAAGASEIVEALNRLTGNDQREQPNLREIFQAEIDNGIATISFSDKGLEWAESQGEQTQSMSRELYRQQGFSDEEIREMQENINRQMREEFGYDMTDLTVQSALETRFYMIKEGGAWKRYLYKDDYENEQMSQFQS